jgi:hypothetical protein
MTHPLLQRLRPPFATRPIERLVNAIRSAIEAEYRGIVVYGLARFGKSWAVKYLVNNASWMGESFYCTNIIVPKSHKRSEGAFFSLWLERFSMALPERSTPLDRLSRLRNYLISKCNENNTDLAVVFMDEAQRLFPEDYEHLATLDNELTDCGYMLMVVFVVQSDFSGAVMERIYEGNPPPHIKGRFLIRRHEFGGLNGVEEIDHALGRMDMHTEWPARSKVSYSQHFAEKAFLAGWRFRGHAAQLLDKANALRQTHRLPSGWTWPMKSFEVCINYLLTNIACKRPDFDGFSDEDIDTALDVSGFIELEMSRGLGGSDD